MSAFRWRRLILIAAAPIAFAMSGGIFVTSGTATTTVSQPYANSFDYGAPATPQAIVPPDLDVQIHVRAPSNQMTDPMVAGHGTDCSAPPATHPIQNLSNGLFACKNHMMTAIGDSDYGEIALTSNHLADWSSGTTSITVSVSTQQFNASDWLEIWLTPFADNTSMPFSGNPVDFQGPPKNAVIFSMNQSALMGTMSGDVTLVQNYVLANSPLPKVACTFIPDPQCINAYGATSIVPLSAVTRVQYEIDISQGHIRFGLPGLVWWTDTNVSVPFSQSLVTLAHHSYNPLKHDAGTGIDTFHWSNLAISNAVPFTMINGAERSINASTSSTIHFSAPAPAGSYLRFSAIGTISVSWDGGASYHAAVMQGLHTHDEHFQTYMTPIPAGTPSVMVRGIDNQYAQPWWIRDPAIWSLTTGPAAPIAVTASASGSDGSANVSWTAPSGTVTGYVVTAYDGCTIQGSMSVTGTPPATSLVFSGLSNGVAYTFKVAAVNADGTGAQSAASNVVVPNGSTAPTWLSACSPRQYSLSGSDGSTWQAMDASNLAVSFTPSASSWAVITGNVDLWTANAGYNQDVGLDVNGAIAAWKESGGFAGTFSPNAATVQAVIPLTAATAYTVKLKWKSNKPDPGSIFAGAGPISGSFSPTRITVQLIPTSAGNLFTTSSTSQYSLGGSNGSTWTDIDSTNLNLSFTPPSGTWTAYVFANADLWTASAGYNQDLGVSISGGSYPTASGQPEAWKESGGFAGTLSPNAAFVQAAPALSGGTTYTVKLQWKANRSDPGAIFAGAGPIGGHYSPTTLTVLLTTPLSALASSTQQRSQANSDGATWQAMDSSNLKWTLSPGVDGNYMISAGADLWTSVAGYNQDFGIMVSGGAYGAGTLVAWKESGGFAGTFSPNAAFVTTDLHLQASNTYNVWVVWKANRGAAASNAIWSGAGPINTHFSPTSLTALQLS